MPRRMTLAMLALLTACRTASYRGDEDSPYYAVPAGSRLVLHRELPVAARRADIYLQGGRVVEYAQVNPYHPYCAFELRTLRAEARTVAVDEFVITRATQEIVFSVRAADRDPGRAPPGRLVGSVGGTDTEGESFRVFATRLELRSERQPDVLRLTCGHWVYPPYETHLSIRQIREALGAGFALKLAPLAG